MFDSLGPLTCLEVISTCLRTWKLHDKRFSIVIEASEMFRNYGEQHGAISKLANSFFPDPDTVHPAG